MTSDSRKRNTDTLENVKCVRLYNIGVYTTGIEKK